MVPGQIYTKLLLVGVKYSSIPTCVECRVVCVSTASARCCGLHTVANLGRSLRPHPSLPSPRLPSSPVGGAMRHRRPTLVSERGAAIVSPSHGTALQLSRRRRRAFGRHRAGTALRAVAGAWSRVGPPGLSRRPPDPPPPRHRAGRRGKHRHRRPPR